MSRLQAAFTHLLISITLAAAVISLIVFGWYPLPYFFAIGGPMLVALIVGIDVVLGPLMTMILFNPAKSRRALTIDLTLIGIVQLSALLYGLHSGYMGRVSYAAFYDKQFHLVYAGDLADKFVAEAPLPEFRHVPWIGYRLVGVAVPDTAQNQSDLAFFKAFGAGPERFPKFYVPLGQMTQALQQAALPRERLQQTNPQLVEQIDKVLQREKLGWQLVAVVPFDLRTTTYTAIVSLSDARMITVLRTNP